MNEKLVSAVITTHNRKELLLKAISSVLKQTYKNIECIVIDDASHDGTEELLHNLIINNKIRYYKINKEESKGGNYARNIGIKNAKGEYIAFLDDDDEWLENKIKKQVEAMEANAEIGFVYCGRLTDFNSIKIVEQDITNFKFQEGDLSKEILIHILTVTSTIMVKRKLLMSVNGFDENLGFWQEYELCIRLLQYTKVSCVRENLVLYRVISQDKNRLSNKIEGWEKAVKYIEDKHHKLFVTLDEQENALRQVYICIDGFNRARQAKSFKYMMKYVWYVIKRKGIRRAAIEKIINKIYK